MRLGGMLSCLLRRALLVETPRLNSSHAWGLGHKAHHVEEKVKASDQVLLYLIYICLSHTFAGSILMSFYVC